MKMKIAITTSLLAALVVTIIATRSLDGGVTVGNSPAKSEKPVQKEAPKSEVNPASSLNSSEPKKVEESFYEKAAPLADSIEQLEREFSNYKTEELQSELNQTEVQMKTEKYIEKANQGTLTEEETLNFINALRRHGVLSKMIAKIHLENIKRKYL